jgi:hypothetical protein
MFEIVALLSQFHFSQTAHCMNFIQPAQPSDTADHLSHSAAPKFNAIVA